MPKKKAKETKPRGPKPDILVIDKNWKEAVRKSFEKKPPPGGWPKPDRVTKSS
jgi:hypothetical protein